ncbi:hypothetical protein [Pseudomonas sp. NFR16]|uniref:hypothetical protein n=1 Tax=Pseudomonas sp. NFR16 TaxID=1566248 RepID=UPI0015A5EFFB|nr:hypothetical protein [Pseudomonas sp. NFR16]
MDSNPYFKTGAADVVTALILADAMGVGLVGDLPGIGGKLLRRGVSGRSRCLIL